MVDSVMSNSPWVEKNNTFTWLSSIYYLFRYYNNTLLELPKDVKIFKGGNLRYFSKNWYKYTKDKYILDIVTNGFKLDLKQLPTQNSRSFYPLPIKENEIMSIQIKTLYT